MKDYLKRVYPLMKPFLGPMLLVLALAIPLALIKAYQTYLLKDLFDHGLTAQATARDVYWLAGILILLQLINYPIRFWHFYRTKVISEQLTAHLRSQIYYRLLRAPLSFFAEKKQGDLLSTIQSDVYTLADSIRYFPGILREPATALGLLAVALYNDWQLTLLLFLAVPLFLIIFRKTGKKIRNYAGSSQKALAQVIHDLTEGITGHKFFKAYHLEHYAADRLQRGQSVYLKQYAQSAAAEEHSHPLVELVAVLALAGILIFAHHRMTEGSLTTGGLISFLSAMAFFMDPIRKYADVNIKMERGKASLDRIEVLLHCPQELNRGAQKPTHFQQQIEFKAVNFHFDGRAVLRDLSFTLSRGEKLAIVGLSGSGKSTLVNLLLRFYQPSSGEITFNGIPIEDIELGHYRHFFSHVSQDVFLFNDTIRENLLTGQLEDSSAMDHALHTAHAFDFIEAMPQGLETIIGDRATKISGGQAQRLTLARAFLRNSEVLIFDEATSALDNESEKMVQAAMEQLTEGKTVVAIAHRLSSIQHYDRILVLKEGRKVEEGTHQELLQLGGEYQKLFELGQYQQK